MLATMIKVEELELDETEAKRIADALVRLKKHYPNVPIAEKTMAWTALMGALGQVYGPRVMAYRFRKKAEKSSQPKQPDNVFNIGDRVGQ